MRAIEGIGLSDVEMDSVLTLVLGHVHGAARGVVDAAQAERRTGMTDAQWWEAAGPVLEKVFDGDRYPTAARRRRGRRNVSGGVRRGRAARYPRGPGKRARQSGKSTLVRMIGSAPSAEWRSLDRAANRHAAAADPTEFVADDSDMVIDEVQRVPDLLLAIKEAADENPRPGRFLLTGSARVLGLRGVPDALPGRVETVELWPFSRGEIDGSADRFVDAAFAQGPDMRHESAERKSDYAERVVRGGFPEAVGRRDHRRRARFFDSYLADLVNRDVIQLSGIARISAARRCVP